MLVWAGFLTCLAGSCSAPPKNLRVLNATEEQPIALLVYGEADAALVIEGFGKKTITGKAVVVPDITGDHQRDLVLGARPKGNETHDFDAFYVVAGPITHGAPPKIAAEGYVPAGAWRLRSADFVDAGDVDGDGHRDLFAWVSLFRKRKDDGHKRDPRVVAPRRKAETDDFYPGYYLIRGPLDGRVPILEGELFPSETVTTLLAPGDIDVDGAPDNLLITPGIEGEPDIVGIVSAPIAKGVAPAQASKVVSSSNEKDSMADVPIAGAMGHCDLNGDAKDDLITWTDSEGDAWRQINIHHAPLADRLTVGDDDAAIYELGTSGQTVVCLGNVDKRAGEDLLIGSEQKRGAEESNKHRDRLRPLDLFIFLTPLRGAAYPADATVRVKIPGLTVYGFGAAGDFDGDGHRDMVVWGESSEGKFLVAPVSLRRVLAPKPLLFIELEGVDATIRGGGVEVADIDGDSYPDLIVGVPPARGKARVLIYSGAALIPPERRGDAAAPPP